MGRTKSADKRVTLVEDQESRTIKVGLSSMNGENRQRVIVLHEPNVVALGKLQTEANTLDESVPRVEPFDDPDNPTPEERDEAQRIIREQHAFIYGDKVPYAHFFLTLIEACSDEKVELEELPSWAANVAASSRRCLDFFKNPLGGPDVADLLAAIQQPGQSS